MGIKGKNDKMVVLACEECKERNYTTTKNKKTNKERMELKKHCQRASLVQLVERRSPKPDVEGSSPSGRDLN